MVPCSGRYGALGIAGSRAGWARRGCWQGWALCAWRVSCAALAGPACVVVAAFKGLRDRYGGRGGRYGLARPAVAARKKQDKANPRRSHIGPRIAPIAPCRAMHRPSPVLPARHRASLSPWHAIRHRLPAFPRPCEQVRQPIAPGRPFAVPPSPAARRHARARTRRRARAPPHGGTRLETQRIWHFGIVRQKRSRI